MSTIQALREEILALSANERASLAHDLILSLDEPAGLELGAAQEAEIERRGKKGRGGTATGRPAEEALADIKAKYQR
jgi:putative addiction module component (TIGR02574 family)